MRPKDHEELNCQVNELLKKGFIYEIMSPCGLINIKKKKKMGVGGYA